MWVDGRNEHQFWANQLSMYDVRALIDFELDSVLSTAYPIKAHFDTYRYFILSTVERIKYRAVFHSTLKIQLIENQCTYFMHGFYVWSKSEIGSEY